MKLSEMKGQEFSTALGRLVGLLTTYNAKQYLHSKVLESMRAAGVKDDDARLQNITAAMNEPFFPDAETAQAAVDEYATAANEAAEPILREMCEAWGTIQKSLNRLVLMHGALAPVLEQLKPHFALYAIQTEQRGFPFTDALPVQQLPESLRAALKELTITNEAI